MARPAINPMATPSPLETMIDAPLEWVAETVVVPELLVADDELDTGFVTDDVLLVATVDKTDAGSETDVGLRVTLVDASLEVSVL